MEYDLLVCICIFTFTSVIHSAFICKFHHDINKLYEKTEKKNIRCVRSLNEVVSDPGPIHA